MTNSIRCFCVAVLAAHYASTCASDRHTSVPPGADAAPQADALYILPDVIAFPQPTGPFTVVRGQRRTLIDPTRDLEGNDLVADAGALYGGDAEAGSTRPLSVEIWYPSDTPGSGSTVPYMDRAEADETVLAAQKAGLLPTVTLKFSPEFSDRVRTHTYANLPFARSLTMAPLLLFSPGYNLQPRSYTAFIEEAVSWGYIVVAMSHTLYTPLTTFADGSTISLTHDVNDSDLLFDADVWLADARFVLGEIVKTASSDPYGEIEGHVDLTKIGMFGHSFGGSTSVGMLANDDRVMAAMDFDGTIYGGNWTTQSFSKPVFIFQEPGADSTMNYLFNSQATGIAFRAVLANSLHVNFSDLGIVAAAIQLDPSLWQANSLGTIDPIRGVQEVNGYVRAFFDSTLGGVPSPLLEGPTAQFPDVVDFSKKP